MLEPIRFRTAIIEMYPVGSSLSTDNLRRAGHVKLKDNERRGEGEEDAQKPERVRHGRLHTVRLTSEHNNMNARFLADEEAAWTGDAER